MTTLQARSWAQVTQYVPSPSEHSRLWATARTALGFAAVVALLAAVLSIRVLVYVHL